MLKRGIEVLVGAALMVMLLAAVPAIAQAQEQQQEGAPPASVVVRPGDTLWSISEEQLGPKATPQRIAGEVERIYALNRDQIGSDPNLIFAGQRFSLPSVGKKQSAQAPAATRGATDAARKDNAKANAKTNVKTNKATSPATQQVNLPYVPEATPVPAAKPLSTNDVSRSPLAHLLENVRSAVSSAVTSAAEALVGVFAEARKSTPDERRLFGLGIIALALLVGALMAWKLPMRRKTGDEKEVWGIYAGYPAGDYPSYPRRSKRRADKAALVEVGSEPYPVTPDAETRSPQNGTSRVGVDGVAQAKRRTMRNKRVRRVRPFPRKGLATGAHAPEVRRCLLRAVPRSPLRRMPPVRAKRVNRKGGR